MARPRLKAPQGQRRQAPGEDVKVQKTKEPEAGPAATRRQSIASPFHTTDPARFLYEAFAESKGWRDPRIPSGKMKKWEELSVHDRKAWASVNKHMFQASGHISIRLPPDDGETVVILRRRGNVFVVEEIPLTSLARISDVRKALAAIEEGLQRLEAEYAGAELRAWHINEPRKFEAPKLLWQI